VGRKGEKKVNRVERSKMSDEKDYGSHLTHRYLQSVTSVPMVEERSMKQ